MEKDRFQEILDQLAEVHERKKKGEDLSNFRICERMGLPAWKGVLAIMGEKMGRLMNLAKSENPDVEPDAIAEILTELATHSIMARILLEDPQAVIKQQDSSLRRGRRLGQKRESTDSTDSLNENAASQPGQE